MPVPLSVWSRPCWRRLHHQFGTGSQMLAVIVPGRAFLDSFKKADISPLVLSRTCEDAGTIGCPLVPSVHAFYIAGVLGVSAFDFAPCIPELVRPHFLHPVRPDRLRHLAFERHAGSRLQKSLKRTTCLRSRM
ncbi:MAG: Na+/H+ antiporter NhaC family protein [Bilophila wadsworthia]